ncbi:hypothetical protein BDV59DRAFT_169124 [Aspergillus ambiguus]|uniref:uncharacterized protein n=1 Tax=Aspergillus ambiguus TaxID=176160 RepID=UPI003CCCBBF7
MAPSRLPDGLSFPQLITPTYPLAYHNSLETTCSFFPPQICTPSVGCQPVPPIIAILTGRGSPRPSTSLVSSWDIPVLRHLCIILRFALLSPPFNPIVPPSLRPMAPYRLARGEIIDSGGNTLATQISCDITRVRRGIARDRPAGMKSSVM